MSLDLIDRLRFRTSNRKYSNNDDQSISVEYQFDDHYNPTTYEREHPLEIFQPLPAYSTILGICQDGLPLVLDLNDPNPGAILISGSQHSGKSQLMKSILFSACKENNVEQLYFYVISPEPGNHADLRRLDQCYGVFSSYDKTACELVVELSALVEQRKSGRHLGVKCILTIENLYEFIKHQDFDVISHLKWLYRFGANNGIWIISTIETDRSNLIEPDLLNEQKTHILSGNEHWTLPDPSADHRIQEHLQSYRTMIGNEWVEFWLPTSSY